MATILSDSKEVTLLSVALAALQDQAAVIDILDNTPELSVEVDAAVIARPVIDTVILQCLQDLLEEAVVTCVRRARTYAC